MQPSLFATPEVRVGQRVRIVATGHHTDGPPSWHGLVGIVKELRFGGATVDCDGRKVRCWMRQIEVMG
jgi:hypothetical protein